MTKAPKNLSHREFLKWFADVKGGELTINRLSGFYVEAIAEDDTIVMFLHTGDTGHGIGVALTYHTAGTLVQALGSAITEIMDDTKKLLQDKDGPAQMTIPIEPYRKAIVRVRVEGQQGLVEPPQPS